MAAGSSAVVGTLAGPVGTAFGAGIGFAIDFLTNEGIEIMKREEFIKEINEPFLTGQAKPLPRDF